MKDTDIKQGLFSAPDGNVSTAREDEKKKTVWQWMLAIEIFKDHPKYGAALQEAFNFPPGARASKAKEVWADKIKN